MGCRWEVRCRNTVPRRCAVVVGRVGGGPRIDIADGTRSRSVKAGGVALRSATRQTQRPAPRDRQSTEERHRTAPSRAHITEHRIGRHRAAGNSPSRFRGVKQFPVSLQEIANFRNKTELFSCTTPIYRQITCCSVKLLVRQSEVFKFGATVRGK